MSKQAPRVIEQAIWKDKIRTRAKIDDKKIELAAEKELQEFVDSMSALMKDDFKQELSE